MFENPELGVWVVKDGDALAFGWRNLVGKTFEIDGGIGIDPPGTTQG